MKTIALSITFIISMFPFSHAQENKEYKWGCSFAISSVEAQLGDPQWASWGYAKNNFYSGNVTNGDIKNKSLSLSIIPKYFINNDILLRLEFGITDVNMISYYDANPHLASNNPTNTVIINQSIEQKTYRYIPGIQFIFIKMKFIESYFGMTGSYLHSSDMKYENLFKIIDLSSDTLIGGFDDNATATGGFAIGMGAFIGFNIYLHTHISLGAEFSSSLLDYKIGGTFSGVVTDLINPNSSANQIYSYSTSSYKGVQFSKVLSSFNVSFWF